MLLTTFLLILSAVEHLTVSVVPRVCLAPCTAVVTVAMPLDPDNRFVDIIVDGEHYGTIETKAILGVSRTDLRLVDLPAGFYLVAAALFRVVDGEVKQTDRVETTLEVS